MVIIVHFAIISSVEAVKNQRLQGWSIAHGIEHWESMHAVFAEVQHLQVRIRENGRWYDPCDAVTTNINCIQLRIRVRAVKYSSDVVLQLVVLQEYLLNVSQTAL